MAVSKASEQQATLLNSQDGLTRASHVSSTSANAARDLSTLVSILHDRAARHSDRIALRLLGDDGLPLETLSYAQLHQSCAALAARLRQHAQVGDRAVLLYPSGAEYVKAFLACAYAGIVAVPAYPPASLEPKHVGRLVAIGGDARPRLVLTESSLLGSLRAAQSGFPAFAQTTVLATDAGDDTGAPVEASVAMGHAEVFPDSVALLQYTSGSTAAPRGVEVSHANLIANERVIADAFGMREDDVVVSWLPLFHDMGLIGTLLQPLYSGACAVLMSPQQFLQRPQRWLEAISRFRGTVSGAPDFAYRLCARRLEAEPRQGLDLSCWRLAFCGAEPVRAATLEGFVDCFAPAGFASSAFYPCYGLAEATLLVTGGDHSAGMDVRMFHAKELERGRARALGDASSAADSGGRALVSCGRARPGHDVWVADVETGERLPENRVGEILVKGPSVARGYFGNARATERTFLSQGGLRTGDLGFLHEGALFVTGRSKDVIIVRGRNLYPQDIESSVEEHVSVVRKGRTVAFSFESNGEECIAVAVEVPRHVQKVIKPTAVCQAIAECIAREHGEAPGVVLLLDQGQVPVTSSGKLQRGACRAAWQAGELEHLMAWSPVS